MSNGGASAAHQDGTGTSALRRVPRDGRIATTRAPSAVRTGGRGKGSAAGTAQRYRTATERRMRAMTDDRFVETVRYQGLYPTREEAAYVIRVTLRALGRQLSPAERADLASALPPDAARHLVTRSSAAAPLTGRALVEEVAERLPRATPANARWGATTVLTLVARLAGPELLSRLLGSLPEDYAPLFGRVLLARSRPA